MKPENEDAPEDQSGGAKQRNHKDSSTTFQRKAMTFAMVTSDIWANPKIVEAGPLAALVFLFALTRNAVRGRTGVLPAADMTPAYVARQLGIDAQTAREALQSCIDANLLSLDLQDDEVYICGWSEEWKRGPLTEAERIRKADYRARKRQDAEAEEEPKKGRKEKKTQTQNKNVRDTSRTGSERVWGLAPGTAFFPPMSKEEEELAMKIVSTIVWYSEVTTDTGAYYAMKHEQQHLVWLMRQGYEAGKLERFAAYMCDDGGAGWANREKDGNFYMRAHCTVHGLFTEKNIKVHWSTALAWKPEYSGWEPRIKEEKKAS